MADHYEVLQVNPRAEPEVIRAAFRALARKHHPDFGGDPGRMAALNEAWMVLGNRERRAAYDAARAGLGYRPPVARPAPRPGPAPAGPIAAAAERRAEARDAQERVRRERMAAERPPGAGSPDEPGTETRAVEPRPPGVLDFGRYEGWAITMLAEHDPDYLLWLARTPIGRPLRAEIDTVLAARAERLARGATATAVADRPSRFGFMTR